MLRGLLPGTGAFRGIRFPNAAHHRAEGKPEAAS